MKNRASCPWYRMCYQDLGPAYMNRAGLLCGGDLRVVGSVSFGVKNADQPGAIWLCLQKEYTWAVCYPPVVGLFARLAR